jgi:hypothetical protein
LTGISKLVARVKAGAGAETRAERDALKDAREAAAKHSNEVSFQ